MTKQTVARLSDFFVIGLMAAFFTLILAIIAYLQTENQNKKTYTPIKQVADGFDEDIVTIKEDLRLRVLDNSFDFELLQSYVITEVGSALSIDEIDRTRLGAFILKEVVRKEYDAFRESYFSPGDFKEDARNQWIEDNMQRLKKLLVKAELFARDAGLPRLYIIDSVKILEMFQSLEQDKCIKNSESSIIKRHIQSLKDHIRKLTDQLDSITFFKEYLSKPNSWLMLSMWSINFFLLLLNCLFIQRQWQTIHTNDRRSTEKSQDGGSIS